MRPPWHYPGKDEVAAYLQAYARKFALPVQYRARVTSLERAAGGYRLHTAAGAYQAAQVIVATGAYQHPVISPIADGLSPDVTQLRSTAYRNPGQIPGPQVLVVGAANSGAQIVADLAPHRVWLSQGAKIPRLPRRILGIPLRTLGTGSGSSRPRSAPGGAAPSAATCWSAPACASSPAATTSRCSAARPAQTGGPSCSPAGSSSR